MTKRFLSTTHKVFLTLIACFIVHVSIAQAPNMINYQGVALNTAGIAIANQSIAIRASIHQSSANGTIVYSEERNVTTDNAGLFDFQIGGTGTTATTGSWTAINWDNGHKFLEIEMDAAGGTNFISMGTQQLVSVPYAQYANKAGALIPTATINPNQINAGGATTNQVLKYNGTNWVPGTDVSAFALPYVGTDGSAQSFKITNTNANGNAMQGECTGNSGIAIKGLSNGTSTQAIGVYGEATAGVGVSGYSNNAGSIAVNGYSVGGIGVNGYSIAGTAVSATSTLGTALDVNGITHLNGSLKINGGNTNPSAGAVLTSDATGNAVWKKNKIGFIASYDPNTNLYLAGGSFSTIPLMDSYDASNSFNNKNAATDPNTFIAPISGLYSFSAYINIYGGVVYDFEYMNAALYVNGISSLVHEVYGFTDAYWESVDFNQKIHLNAGDKVVLKVNHEKTVNTTSLLVATEFSGVLVFED
ncbi:MAG: hypothetical protein JNM95_06380 [Chitinophagaceae bacterium]|nr:hypothetical protein [Chitinophagaceae bacterium]